MMGALAPIVVFERGNAGLWLSLFGTGTLLLKFTVQETCDK